MNRINKYRFGLLLAGGLSLIISLPLLTTAQSLLSNTHGLQPNASAPDFTLLTDDNQSLHLASIDKPVILSFGYKSCGHTCPTQMTLLRATASQLGNQVKYLWISLDPLTDRQLPSLKKQYQFPELIELYPESTAETAYLLAQFKGRSQKTDDNHRDFSHTNFVYVIDQQQSLRLLYQASNTKADNIIADLITLNLIPEEEA